MWFLCAVFSVFQTKVADTNRHHKHAFSMTSGHLSGKEI